jgi:hypothetical protein
MRSMTTSVRQTESRTNSRSLRSAGQAGANRPRQYARLVGDWIHGIGLDPCMFGTHSGHADLSTHRQSERRPVAAWPYQDREHSVLPRHWGRRCSGNSRAQAVLSVTVSAIEGGIAAPATRSARLVVARLCRPVFPWQCPQFGWSCRDAKLPARSNLTLLGLRRCLG